jgi:hypothetical protein
VKTDSKSNEITAIPRLLELLDLKGALVTIEAMGCQTEIADAILDSGGDYLLAVKGNQPSLEAEIREVLDNSTPATRTKPRTTVTVASRFAAAVCRAISLRSRTSQIGAPLMLPWVTPFPARVGRGFRASAWPIR